MARFESADMAHGGLGPIARDAALDMNGRFSE